jgi:hypothetical protein
MLLPHRYNTYLSDDSQRIPDDPFLTRRSFLTFVSSRALPICSYTTVVVLLHQ